MNETELIDETVLDRRTMGNADLRREVLRLFDEQCGAWLAALDTGEWARLGHTIKGSAAGIGAETLAEAAASFEEAPDDARTLRDLLKATQRRARQLAS